MKLTSQMRSPTVRSFTVEESAAVHSHIGAFVLMNGVVLDWTVMSGRLPQLRPADLDDALPLHGLLHFKRRQINLVDPCVSLKPFHHVLR